MHSTNDLRKQVIEIAKEHGFELHKTYSKYALDPGDVTLSRLWKLREILKDEDVKTVIVPTPKLQRAITYTRVVSALKGNPGKIKREGYYLTIADQNTPKAILQKIQHLVLDENWKAETSKRAKEVCLPTAYPLGTLLYGNTQRIVTGKADRKCGYLTVPLNNPGADSPRLVLTEEDGLIIIRGAIATQEQQDKAYRLVRATKLPKLDELTEAIKKFNKKHKPSKAEVIEARLRSQPIWRKHPTLFVEIGSGTWSFSRSVGDVHITDLIAHQNADLSPADEAALLINSCQSKLFPGALSMVKRKEPKK